MMDTSNVPTGPRQNPELEEISPPITVVGPVAWLRTNLFSSPFNTLLTILAVLFLAWAVPPFIRWAFIDATWTFPREVLDGARGPNRGDCAPDGACWIFIQARIGQFLFGFYPADERWRVVLVFILTFGAVAGMLIERIPFKKQNALFLFVILPILSLWLLLGGLGLEVVSSRLWGGFMLTLIIACVGIVLALPLGILLALGRRSELPVVHLLSVMLIEFVRGVPLITVLFMANVMLPLFLPPGTTIDPLLRILVGFTVFTAAYLAEVVRGGLQAIGRGQYEGAASLGLGYWSMMRLIILPQALRISIPAIVNTINGAFMDTTLVAVVGLYDFLNIVRTGSRDANWIGTEIDGFVFCAAIYWICCYGMSRYSISLERKLDTGHKKR
ncbi:amino acid ABC transporter permease [Dongia soli]|uniref:Amino acid ABC transporter permease n=1 Tax=Dongia soli TaxID=600628 RepID=A0ABU5EFM9_9PROT|nr:amino acid ABC transporter permease [Dongia soli]MDY0885023.1 amino acid ABC transporter permease [Dongia soli]